MSFRRNIFHHFPDFHTFPDFSSFVMEALRMSSPELEHDSRLCTNLEQCIKPFNKARRSEWGSKQVVQMIAEDKKGCEWATRQHSNVAISALSFLSKGNADLVAAHEGVRVIAVEDAPKSLPSQRPLHRGRSGAGGRDCARSGNSSRSNTVSVPVLPSQVFPGLALLPQVPLSSFGGQGR